MISDRLLMSFRSLFCIALNDFSLVLGNRNKHFYQFGF